MKATLADSTEVTVSLGGPAAVFPRDRWRVDLQQMLPGAGSPVEWAGLDALARLSTVWYRGADRGFLAWLGTRSGIREIHWTAPEIDVIDLSARPIGTLADLAAVTIFRPKGPVANMAALGKLADLRSFCGVELYAFDAASFPAPPVDAALYQVEISGLRAEDAKLLRRRLKNVPEVRFAKAAWLAANVDNPLADWGDADAALGKTATKLWRAALGAARKAGASPGKEQASAVVASLIAGLNKAGQFIGAAVRARAFGRGDERRRDFGAGGQVARLLTRRRSAI